MPKQMLHTEEAGELAERSRISSGLKRRDAALIDELIARYHGRLLRYLHSLVRRQDLAEDLLQETWMRVIERGHLYNHAEGRFESWLYAVARNQALDLLRRRPHLSLDSLLQPEDDSAPLELSADLPCPLDNLRNGERSAAIREALDQLQPIHREVLVLHFYEDLTMREIAERTGIQMATVKSRLYRAVGFFHRLLREGLANTALYNELSTLTA